jgi:hypothetical protein
MKVNYSEYLRVCSEAVKNEVVFSTFKKRPAYTYVLEHVSEALGYAYLEEIKKEFPYLLQHIERFATNDDIGKPKTYYIEELGMKISPTTLRYVKVLGDLMNLFGRLDNMDIIEIGGGYGGQYKIIHDIARPKSYTLVDLSKALGLSKKYLERYNINNTEFKTCMDGFKPRYDLCISNYAFTEVSRADQLIYAEHIIKHSDRGYITCNYLGQRTEEEGLSKDEIFALRDNYKILPEQPLTAVNNLIYTW